MKTERFGQQNYQLESKCESWPRLAPGRANADYEMLRSAVQQDERKRIAQELHDTLLQGFTSISLKLDALTTGLPPGLSETKQQFQRVLEQMDHYLGETRRSIWNLRSQTLQSTQDFSSALMEASERALAGTTIALKFSMQGTHRKLANVVEHHVLRICEEALANVVKHAQATRVEVVLDFSPREVQLQVRDNGRGFEPTSSKVSKGDHFGLLGIEERVAAISGMVSVDSGPGRGTRLLVTIPIKGSPRQKEPKVLRGWLYCRPGVGADLALKLGLTF